MSFFNFFKNNNNNNNDIVELDKKQELGSTRLEQSKEVFLDLNKGSLLNLNKNEFLNLSKTGLPLTNVRLSAGWDVNSSPFGRSYDLDLCVHLLDKNNNLVDTIAYFHMKAKGIYLDGDNLTGEGDGDDENIFIQLHKLPDNVHRAVASVVIYNGKERKQEFSKVRNAYVRLVEITNKGDNELARFNLTEDGGNATAVVFAELRKDNGEWLFHTIGEYKNSTIRQLF